MPIRQRYPHLPKAVEYAHIGWDLLILAAVVLNLSLLLFDSLFLIGPINQAIAAIAPGFHRFYDTAIHSRSGQSEAALRKGGAAQEAA